MLKGLSPFVFFQICLASVMADQGAEWVSRIKHSGVLDTSDVSGLYAKVDLSHLWRSKEDQLVLGYVGPNFQRLRISFDSVEKKGGRQYRIVGKSRVYKEICLFVGTLKMEDVYHGKSADDDCENTVRPTVRGVIVGKYHLQERTCRAAGTFRGVFSTNFYVKDGVVEYDTLDGACSDDFHNHSFVGEWESHKTNEKKVCNWGDHRIPFSGQLDNGASEFYPVEKYWGYGWRRFHELQNGKRMDSLDTFEKDNKP